MIVVSLKDSLACFADEASALPAPADASAAIFQLAGIIVVMIVMRRGAAVANV